MASVVAGCRQAPRKFIVKRPRVVAALSQWSRVRLRASISNSTQVTKAWPRSKFRKSHVLLRAVGGLVSHLNEPDQEERHHKDSKMSGNAAAPKGPPPRPLPPSRGKSPGSATRPSLGSGFSVWEGESLRCSGEEHGLDQCDACVILFAHLCSITSSVCTAHAGARMYRVGVVMMMSVMLCSGTYAVAMSQPKASRRTAAATVAKRWPEDGGQGH